MIPGIRKSAPDHRPSRLPVQEPHVLFILFILFIDVNYKKDFRSPAPAGIPPHLISLRGLAPRWRGSRIVLHATVGAPLVGAQSGNHRVTTRVAPTLGGTA